MSSANKEHVIHLQTANRGLLLAAIGKHGPHQLITIARSAGIISAEDYDYVHSDICSDNDRAAVIEGVIKQIEGMLDHAAHLISKAAVVGSGIGGGLLQAAIVHYDKAQQFLAGVESTNK